MKKYLSIIAALWFSISSVAHDPNTSTLVLAEKENNVWVLQISASLTAFQQEVNTHFSETPYKTPEEFNEMVLAHIRNTLEIRLNGQPNISLSKGVVKLGHETKVVFELPELPSDFQSIEMKNTIFEDIYRDQSTLFILKNDLSKSMFTFNAANNHRIALIMQDGGFVEQVHRASFVSTFNLMVVFFVAMLVLIGFKFYKKLMALKSE